MEGDTIGKNYLTVIAILAVIFLIMGGLLLAVIVNTHLSQPDVFGRIDFIPAPTIPADDPQVRHLTEQDFLLHPGLNLILTGEDPPLTARIVRDMKKPGNPQPAIAEDEGFSLYFAYRGGYVEWNGTVYLVDGWVT